MERGKVKGNKCKIKKVKKIYIYIYEMGTHINGKGKMGNAKSL